MSKKAYLSFFSLVFLTLMPISSLVQAERAQVKLPAPQAGWAGHVWTDSFGDATGIDSGLSTKIQVTAGNAQLATNSPSVYASRPDTAAWYHLDEGNPPDPYPGVYDPLDPTLAWYQFNEGSGTTTADVGGAINDIGTLNAPIWNYGPSSAYRRALSFDGNDRVTVPDSTDLNPTTGITIEAWVNPSATKDNNYVAIKQTDGGSDYAYGLKVNSGVIGAFIRNSGTLYWAYGGSVPQGSWSHIAMTYQLNPVSATYVTLYLNGSEVSLYTQRVSIPANTQIATNTGPLNIGVIPVSTPIYYEGIMDELRIVGRALTPAEIATDGTITPPTGYVQDSTPNDNDGTPNNSVHWNTGQYALGASFDGTSGLINVPDNNTLDLTTGITIEAWVNPAEAKANNYLLSKTAGATGFPDYTYGFKLENEENPGSNEIGGIIGSTSSATGLYFAYGGSVPTSTWTHIAMTYQMDSVNPSHIRLYQNGQEVTYRYGNPNKATDMIPAGAFIRTNAVPLKLGTLTIAPSGSKYFHGTMDEVRILPYALTPCQIAEDAGVNYPCSGVVTSVVVTPPEGENWALFQVAATTLSGTSITYQILNEAGTSVLMDNVLNGANITGLNAQPIRLRANLVTSNPLNSPLIDSWSLTAYLPTAVQVSDFTASTIQDGTRLTWQTASEIGLTGFNLYRSATQTGQKVLLAAIPAKHPGQMLPSSYEYTDPFGEGQTWYYWLEVLGTGEWLGPLGPLTPLPPLPYKVMLPILIH